MKIIKALLIKLSLTGVACFLSINASASSPAPVVIVLPFAVGGGADIMARVVQKSLSNCMPNRIFLVESRPGASGEIAARWVANSRDGTKLLLATPSLVISNIKKNEYYDLEKDLEPVFFLGHLPLVLTTSSKNTWTSMSDLMQSKRELTYSSAGTGTTSHLNGFEVGKIMKQNLVHVPYKGLGNTIPDLISGVLDFGFIFGNIVVPLMRSNQLKPLAIIGDQRSPQLPNVPTFKELGYANIDFNTWFMLLANQGADPSTVKDVKDCLRKTLSSQQDSALFRETGLQYNVQDFFRGRNILQNEIHKYREYLQKNPFVLSM
jgi:tripartite-type tricarboxylate transporter receptor subunit TctC